jgi:hypothetical protein
VIFESAGLAHKSAEFGRVSKLGEELADKKQSDAVGGPTSPIYPNDKAATAA